MIEPTPEAEHLLRQVLELTVRDVAWLNAELRRYLEGDDDEEGGSGVREPRHPYPESPGDAIALQENDG